MNTRNFLRTILASALLCGAAAFCHAEEEEPRQIILPRDITTAKLKFNNSDNAADTKPAEEKARPAVYKSSAATTKVTYIFVHKDADKKTPARWNTPNKQKKGAAAGAAAKKAPAVKTVVKKLKITQSKYAAVSLNSSKKGSGNSKLKKPDANSDIADQIAGGGDGGVHVGGK